MRGRVIAVVTPSDRPFAAALVVDGRLEDLVIAPRNGDLRPFPGQELTARVTRKLPKSGAFCALEGGGEGFLRDARDVAEGQSLPLAVQSLPEPGKALTLTSRLLRKGPHVILTPGAPGVNVSRKIGNPAERDRLEALARTALEDQPETLGAILRTEAKGASERVIGREIEALLQAAPTALQSALRDWLSPAPDRIFAPQELARTWLAEPRALFSDEAALRSLEAEADAFSAFGIWDEVEALRSPSVSLGDASMSVEPTRALVAVDVDTGADFSPAAGLKTNLGVARELPRQLRLRGLGGKILVDFAPMPKPQRRSLEEALAKAFRADQIETALVGWTRLGLFEIQRKRERWPLTELL